MTTVTVEHWDEENKALRDFLMYYGGNTGCDVQKMREHMELAGHPGCWPEWVDGPEGQGHLTKAGAQDWIKYLLLYTDNEEAVTDDGIIGYTIMAGDPSSGVTLFGNYRSNEDACEAAANDVHLADSWWVVPIYDMGD